MDMVAAEAGTTKRTVYNQFDDKQALLTAIIDWSMELFAERLGAAGKPGLPSVLALIVEMTCWRDAVGLQRLLIAEAETLPDLATSAAARMDALLMARLAGAMTDPRKSLAATQTLVGRVLMIATAQARFDRLFGLRPPYPDPPGGNALDALDRAAVRAAIEASNP